MARNRGKKALYEVIDRSKMKPGGRTTDRLHPADEQHGEQVDPTASETAEAVVEAPETTDTSRVAEPEAADRAIEAEIEAAAGDTGVHWRKKPRPIQVNGGRVEFSVPYQAVVAAVLILVLMVIGAYRLGQRSGTSVDPGIGGGSGGPTSTAGLADPTGPVTPSQPIAPVERVAPTDVGGSGNSATTEPPVSTGSNRIVIQTFRQKEDLVPVSNYFAAKGIATEIIKIRDMYYLVTSNKYENPSKAGTDGFAALARIIEVGAGYQAPEGYEKFTPNLFRDAFGMKFDD